MTNKNQTFKTTTNSKVTEKVKAPEKTAVMEKLKTQERPKQEERQVVAPIKVESISIDKTRTYLYETDTRKLAKDILADGYVSHDELLKMEANHEEIIRDFLVSTEKLEKMKKNPSAYSPAELDAIRYIVTHLMRAREISLAKMQQLKYANFIPPVEKELREERRRRKEHLDINFNLYQIFALNGSAHEVVEYARNQEKNRIMTPQEAKKTEKRIMRLINLVIEKGKDERYIRQFLENDQEHVA